MRKYLGKVGLVVGLTLGSSWAVTANILGALALDTLWTPSMENPAPLVGNSYYTGGPYPFVSGGSFDTLRTMGIDGKSEYSVNFDVSPGMGTTGDIWVGGGISFVLATVGNVQSKVDVSSLGGVCLSYEASYNGTLHIANNDWPDFVEATLPRTTKKTTRYVPFYSFALNSYSNTSRSAILGAAKTLQMRLPEYRGSYRTKLYGIGFAQTSSACQTMFPEVVAAAVPIWSPKKHGDVLHQVPSTLGGGYWYTYDDSDKGGNTSVLPANSLDGSTTSAFFAKTGSATAAIRLGYRIANPFGALAVEFYPGRASAYDASAQNSVCLTYRAARPFRMKFYQQDEVGYDRYGATVDSSASFKVLKVAFAKLAREGWDNANSYAFDPSKLTGFIFEYNASHMQSRLDKDSSNTVEINQLGFGDACDLSTVPESNGAIHASLLYDATSSLGDAGISNKAGSSGWWYTFKDSLGSMASPWSLAFSESLVDSARVIPFNAALANSTSAYAGVGFNWHESDESPMDLSSHGSLCVTYRSTAPFDAYLNQSYASNDNKYFYSLPVQTSFKARSIPFSAFSQSTGWGYAQVLDLSRQKAISFQRRGLANAAGKLEIAQVGFDGACQDVNVAPIVLGGVVGTKTVGYHGAALSIDEDDTLTLPKSLFSDYEGDAIILSLAAHDSAKGVLDANGALLVIPGENIFTDTDTLSLTVLATDAQGNVASWPISLAIMPVNDAPVASAKALGNLSMPEEASLALDASGLFTDVDDASLSYMLSSTSAKVSIDGLTVKGLPDSIGVVPLMLVAMDASGAKAESHFSLTIINVNDTPVVAKSLPVMQLNEGFDHVAIYIGSLFTDKETSTLAYTASSLKNIVALVVDGDSLRIVAMTGKTGGDIITVVGSDGNASASVSFLLDVKGLEHSGPQFATQAKSWRSMLQTAHGFGEVRNMQGKLLRKVALPAEERDVMDAVRTAGGHALLRIEKDSWHLQERP